MHLRPPDAQAKAGDPARGDGDVLPRLSQPRRLSDERGVGRDMRSGDETRAEGAARFLVGRQHDAQHTPQLAGLGECESGVDHRRDGAFHVRRAEPEQAAVLDDGIVGGRLPLRLVPWGLGVEVPVQDQRAVARADLAD
jgi:hypothetical protein